MFFYHNFLTTHTRGPSNGSKDADFRLVYFKRKNNEIDPCIFSQAPMASSKNPLSPTHDITPKNFEHDVPIFS